MDAVLELDDPRHRPVEEGAVVRDHDDAPADTVHEALQPLEPVEVEVVRRLVEAVDVVARQQQDGEPRTGRLSARERVDPQIEPLREAELGRDRRKAGLGCGGPAVEVPAQGLAGTRVELLREVADREIARAEPDEAPLGLVEPREQAQQRRLAGPVRADDADPAARADGERDAAEDLGDAMRDGGVDERDRV